MHIELGFGLVYYNVDKRVFKQTLMSEKVTESLIKLLSKLKTLEIENFQRLEITKKTSDMGRFNRLYS